MLLDILLYLNRFMAESLKELDELFEVNDENAKSLYFIPLSLLYLRILLRFMSSTDNKYNNTITQK